MKTGQRVLILKSKGHWSSDRIAQIGIVEDRNRALKGTWFVRFDDGFCASYYKKEVKVL